MKRIRIAALAVLAFETSVFAAGTNSPPHVDTSGVNLQPAYPQTAIQNAERGAVVLGVSVSAEGRVNRVSLIETSGFNDLDATAVSAVLGWKFSPAMEDGSPVEGTAAVRLVFEPPAPSPDAANPQQPQPAAPQQQPPPSSKMLFPTQMTLSAPDRKEDARTVPIPCRRGAFEATIVVQRDAKQGGEMAQFMVQLGTGHDSAIFAIDHVGANLVGATILRAVNGEAQSGSHYFGSGEMGMAIPISVDWGSGQVIGNGGRVFGQHQVGFGENPERLEISAYSGDVTVSNARLVCLPDNR